MRAYLFLCLFIVFACSHTSGFAKPPSILNGTTVPMAEDSSSTTTNTFNVKDTFVKSVKLNFLLRSSLEIPLGDDSQARMAQNEIRLESLADITPNLSYRVRYRLNRSQAQKSLDNAPGSLDIAYVQYRFGNKSKWDLTVGKQAAMVGSWEFEKNPTFEYQYTDYINQQLNLFLTAIRIGYKPNPRNAFYLQLHNTFNDNFSVTHANNQYEANGLKASKLPLGIYAAWQGSLWEDRIKTFWSYHVSSFAKDKTNHSIALGNKIVLPRFEAYLDLQHTNMGVDFPNLISPFRNAYYNGLTPGRAQSFAQDVKFNTAVLRADYQFVNKWYITAKGFFESARLNNDPAFGGIARKNYGFLTGIEFKPVDSQNMRLFSYYYFKQTAYYRDRGIVMNDRNVNMLAVGVLYFVNVL
jgi:hypothetical protein